MDYSTLATTLKAISSPIRLEILNLLSCGELCACDLLEHFQITQPTLSHHMKSLQENGLITLRKDGNRHYYRLHQSGYNILLEQLQSIGTAKDTCACHSIHKGACS